MTIVYNNNNWQLKKINKNIILYWIFDIFYEKLYFNKKKQLDINFLYIER